MVFLKTRTRKMKLKRGLSNLPLVSDLGTTGGQVVPEPNMLALVVFGLLGLIVGQIRRKK